MAELSSCDKDRMAQSLTFLQKRATSQTADFCSGIVMIRDPNVVLNEIKNVVESHTLCTHTHTQTPLSLVTEVRGEFWYFLFVFSTETCIVF